MRQYEFASWLRNIIVRFLPRLRTYTAVDNDFEELITCVLVNVSKANSFNTSELKVYYFQQQRTHY